VKPDKLPLNPHDGTNAKANDPATWGTYEEALRYAFENGLRGNVGGIGFEFANGYAGIDLDDVFLAGGILKPFADEVVRLMDSYTEYSPSGKGLHILFKLNRPLSEFGSRRRNDELGIEMYDCGRYFTVTGQVYGEAKPIAERTETARKIYDVYLAKSTHKIVKKGPLRSPERVVSEGADDSELLERMLSSQHGVEIRALFGGDTSGYSGDESRADLALCSYLAFWTNNDTARIDALFRQSGLMRRKWDEKRGTQTYGQMTISKALIAGGGYSSINEHQSFMTIQDVNNSSNPTAKASETISEPDTMLAEMINIQSYIQGSEQAAIDDDLSRFQRYKDRKTGYSNIDAKMSLYPGLYVLGAISSLGKTTFCGQMADQLAGMGEHVLYFTLEQTRLELVCKGLSRLMAQNDMRTALTSMEIRRGSTSDALRIARELYAAQTEHEFIIECGFETNVEIIVSAVKDYISRTGCRPIVVVDYLQIISPVMSHQTTKDVVDYNVRALKKLQTENDLVVLVISSLNRSNYLTPIDFSSFKESGGIEYTADVIWGLQLPVMNDELFDKEAKLKAKREAVKEAKVANPRDIELVCLKNRYGVSSYSCSFKYYARYDYFLPVNHGSIPF
jgi:replicative DNA helicase